MNTANEIIDYYNFKKIPLILDTKINIDKKKYIVPVDMTISQFNYLLRNKITSNEKQGLIIFINNTLPTQMQTFGELYNLYKNEDDAFLYMKLTQENTFG